MASAEAVFAVILEDRLSSPAAKAKASISSLSSELTKAKGQLAGYQSQLGLAKELGDVAGYQKYSALVKGAQQNVFDLGQKAEGAAGGLGDAGAAAGLTSGAFTLVAAEGAAAAGALAGLVAVTESLVVKSLEVVNANQLMAAQFEAMGKGPGAGGKTLDMLNGLAEKLPQSREQLAQWTRQIEKMGITDLSKVRSELVATASAQAVLGEGGAEAYEKISRKVNDAVEGHHALKVSSKELTRTIGTGLTADVAQRMGLSLGDLEAKLKAGTVDAQKFGDALNQAITSKGKGPLDVMMNSLTTMGIKAKEALSHLFDGIDTKPLTDALRSVISLGDQGAPSGQTLKAGLTAGLNGVISALGRGITAAEIFFLKIEIAGLQAYVALKPLIRAVGQISSAMGSVGSALGSAADKTAAKAGVDPSVVKEQGTRAGAFVVSGFGGPIATTITLFMDVLGSLGNEQAQAVARQSGVKVGQATIEGIRAGTQTHSPSLAAIKIGMGIGEGLGQGMEASPAPARAARTISGNALGGIGGKAALAPANGNAAGPVSNVVHINITAPEGVTDAHQLSVIGLATALERFQIGSGR